MFFHGHCSKEIIHLPQPSRNALVVVVPSKAFGGDILIDNLFTTLTPIEPQAAASLGFRWIVNIPTKSAICFNKPNIRTLASWGAATGKTALGACEDSPSAIQHWITLRWYLWILDFIRYFGLWFQLFQGFRCLGLEHARTRFEGLAFPRFLRRCLLWPSHLGFPSGHPNRKQQIPFVALIPRVATLLLVPR